MEILMAAGVPKRREGGVAAIVYNMGRGLEARGHGVSYLFYEDLMSDSELVDRFRDSRFAIRLAKHIRRNGKKYSVVNLHSPTGFIYGMARKIFPSHGDPPYVMTLHGLEDRRIHAMKREQAKGRAWHFAFRNRLWHRVYHLPRYFLSIKTADRSHCYSREVWTILQLKYDLETAHVAYIPNGVEARFLIERSYAARMPVRLLYAGTWLDQRGIYYLRDALNSLNATCRDWTLTIAGSGVAERELIAFFGEPLRAQLRIVPVVPSAEMPQLYAEHDIFVFPSLMEGLPGVLLEAMASGMPVITAETCGMIDVVEDGWNGLLIPPADAPAIEHAILQLVQCPDLRRKLGTIAQERMRRLTWQHSAEQMERLFLSCIQPGQLKANAL
jgi:glycosyltransferase involved in cell wall biosynthesis